MTSGSIPESAARRSRQKRYYAALPDALKSLLVDANRGAPLDVRRGYRKLASGSHFIYYRAIPAGVEVVRILHQAMDAKRHL